MQRRQGEGVGRRIQAVAHGWGWKQPWHRNNSIIRDQQARGQCGKMGGMDIYGMVGGTEANGVCSSGIWATNGKDWGREAGSRGCTGEDDGNG